MISRQDVFEQFDALTRSLALLFPELPPQAQDWRPREGMRSIWEVANHLAQIPTADTAIAQERTQQEVQALESALHRADAAGLLAVWREGLDRMRDFYGGLSEEQFATGNATYFYGHAEPLRMGLLASLAHAHHHRAQLFHYLRETGKDLNGFQYLYA